MTSILFNGCSLTQGIGLTDENLDPKLWTNQLAHRVFDNPCITNLAEAGRNKINYGSDGCHPGYASQDLYVEYLTNQLNKKLGTL